MKKFLSALVHYLASTVAILLAFGSILLLFVVIVLNSSATMTKHILPLVTKFTDYKVKANEFRITPRGEFKTLNLQISAPGTAVKLDGVFLVLNLKRLLVSGGAEVEFSHLDIDGAQLEFTSPKTLEKSAKKAESGGAMPRLLFDNASITNSSVRYVSEHASYRAADIQIAGKNIVYPGNINLRGGAKISIEDPNAKLSLTGNLQANIKGTVSSNGARPATASVQLSDLKGVLGTTSLDGRTIELTAKGNAGPARVDLSPITVKSSAGESGMLTFQGEGHYELKNGSAALKFSSLVLDSDIVQSVLHLPILERVSFKAHARGAIEHRASAAASNVSTTANVELDFPILQLANGDGYSSTSLRGEFGATALGWSIKDAAIVLRSGETELSDIQLDATQNAAGEQSVQFRSSLLNVEKIQAMSSFLKEPQNPEDTTASTVIAPTEAPPPMPVFPKLRVTGTVAQLTGYGLTGHNVDVTVHSDTEKITVQNLAARLDTAEFNATASVTNTGTLDATAHAVNLRFDQVLQEVNKQASSSIDGTVEGARLTVQATEVFAPDPVQRVTATFQSNISEVQLPSRFQDLPPLNIIFVPFSVFSKVVGTLGTLLLPESITSSSGALTDSLAESGRLYIKKGQIDLKLDKGVVTIPSTTLNTNLLPTVLFEGTIGVNGDIDLVSRIKLLEVLIPLPIGGTLSSPIPNVVTFIPALIESLGLSVTGLFNDLNPFSNTEVEPREIDNYLNGLKQQMQEAKKAAEKAAAEARKAAESGNGGAVKEPRSGTERDAVIEPASR